MKSIKMTDRWKCDDWAKENMNIISLEDYLVLNEKEIHEETSRELNKKLSTPPKKYLL